MGVQLTPGDYQLSVELSPFEMEGQSQSLTVFWNEHLIGETSLSSEQQVLHFSIPASIVTGDVDVIRFIYGYAVSPFELGQSGDRRKLGVYVSQITFANLLP